MRIIVTGGSGFIGTNFVADALQHGHDVVNFDIVPPRNPQQISLWRRVDLLDSFLLESELCRFNPTHILHLAACTDLDESKPDNYAANITGVQNLVSALASLPRLERTIFTSSMLVCRYGYAPVSNSDYCPDTAYGRSKMLGEQIVRAAALIPGSWTITRPTSIWGPWSGPPYREFFERVIAGRYFQPGKLEVPKALGFVGNTSFQLLRLLEGPADSVHRKVFYLLDYERITIREWAVLIQRLSSAPKLKTLPMSLVRTLSRTGDVLKWLGYQHPPLTSFRLRNMVTASYFDTSVLRGIVGPLPYAVDEGVQITIGWLRERQATLTEREEYSSRC
jgi:nucleoside-diphosphate-sugar epimerase